MQKPRSENIHGIDFTGFKVEQNYLFAHFIFESPRPSKQLPAQIHQ